MAWHFVRLKYRVTGRMAGAGSAWSILGLIALWLGALGAGVGGGAIVAAAAHYFNGSFAFAVLVGVVVQVAWIVVPILLSTLDSTIDPRWFELLPLRTGQLARGLVLAGMFGPGGLATFLFTLIAFGWGYWPGWVGVVTAPLIALAMTYLGVLTGRLVTTVLLNLLNRFDFAAVGPVIGLMFAGFSLWMSNLSTSGAPFAEGIPEWIEILAVIPGGALGAIAGALDHGPVWVGALALAWTLVLGRLMTWGLGRALDRLQTVSVTARTSRSRSAPAGSLGSRLARLVPSLPVRAAAAKEARYLRRDPKLRGQIVGGIVTVVMFTFIGVAWVPARFAPLLAVLVTWAAVSTLAPNQFGADAGSIWAYVASPASLATVLVGKNVTAALVVAPLAIIATVVGTVIAGSLRLFLVSLLLSLAVGLVWMLVGNVTSIYGAFRYSERNAFGAGPQSGRAIGTSILGLAAAGALTAPILVVTGVAYYFGESPGATVAAAAAVVYAMVLFRAGFQWARTAVIQRQFDLLEVLDQV